jgi:thiol oxidase
MGLAVTEAILTRLCWQVHGSVEHGDFGELCPLMALLGRMTVMELNELSEFYSPFAATPSDWEGCAGSQSHYRGYPCSLWTLFHTLIEGAADNDPAFCSGRVSTVANAMIGYIRKFFSCRECADHFSRHVSQQGYLPHTGDQSLLRLWTIHNKANLMLAGVQTEDPISPKIQWPSAQTAQLAEITETAGALCSQ